jgi:tripartite ATP-independent transporter DctM subunit
MLTALILLVILMFLGIPLFYSIGTSVLAYFLLEAKLSLIHVIALRMFNGINVYVFIAVPLFMFAGEIMMRTTITDRIIGFANLLVGHFRGGLAYVNVLDSMFFGGITGLAIADISALGSVMIPAMKKQGYPPGFTAAITAGTALQGSIIPPSVIMVLYAAMVGNVSIGAMFIAGIIPGIMFGLTDAVVVAVKSVIGKFPKSERRATLKEVAIGFRDASIALIMPFIIIGGIVGGIFTPTEAAAVATAYALIVGFVVYRNLRLRDLIDILKKVAVNTSTLLLVVAIGNIISWIATREHLSEGLANLLLRVTDNPVGTLFIVIAGLLFIGMWLDAGPAIVILAPIIAPAMEKLGFHPIYFGMIMILTLVIGFITPPYGICLFAVSAVGQIKIKEVSREIWWFVLANVTVVMIAVVFPETILFLPRLFGFLT